MIEAGVHVRSTLEYGVDNNGYSADLFNFGRISAGAFEGVYFYLSSNAFIFNEHSGVITGSFVGLDEAGTGDVVKNKGHISSPNIGVLLGAISKGSELLNYGSIKGGHYGVLTDTNNGGDQIVNYGKISSAHNGVDLATNVGLTTSIVNKTSGVISGHDHAIFVDTDGHLLLMNYGTINGNIKCAAEGDDVIHNHGKIHGAVELYSPGDYFNGSGGTSGAIFCGSGDHVIAGKGNVTIHVGNGDNTLTGGPGHDKFVFGTALGSIDTITNFKHGVDTVALSGAVFAGLGPHGTLDGAHFHLGAPVNGHAQIDYFESTGVLEYCPNGSAGPAFHFATLTNHAHITTGDFSLIA
jgi:hypothetical protein